MHGLLPTEDNLITIGMCLTSICLMCYTSVETAEHLSLQCPYIVALWNVIGDIFSMSNSRGSSLVSMFEACCRQSCSSQVRPL